MKKLSDYIDTYGLICQIEDDGSFGGGDSANRCGLLAVASEFNNGLYQADLDMSKEHVMAACNSMFGRIETRPGVGIRHPEATKWWSNSKFFSRDQQSAVVIGAGFSNNQVLVLSLFKNHLKRFGLYQNFQINSLDVDGKKHFIQGDMATPEHFNYYVRALNLWALYPVLLIGDLFMLLNSIIIVIKSIFDADDTSNDLNHICALLQAKRKLPTPISWLARKVYRFFRMNAGQTQNTRLSGFGPLTALQHYFRSKGAPPMDVLFQGFLEKEL